MNNQEIIELYKKGYSINYITNKYYRFMNRNNKPIYIEGEAYFPVKLLTKSDCRLHVVSTIYDDYIIKGL